MGVTPLFQSVSFHRPVLVDDGFGGKEKSWTQAHVARAEFFFAKGDEVVQAGRLAGKVSWKIKIRSCSAARAIAVDWRMTDERRDVDYNVREVDSISDQRWVWLVAESGVVT